MITSKEEYEKKLIEIQLMKDRNYFTPIPESEKIYKSIPKKYRKPIKG